MKNEIDNQNRSKEYHIIWIYVPIFPMEIIFDALLTILIEICSLNKI